MIQRIHDSGEVAKTYRYDAFGNEETPEPLDANPLRYCGEYFDAETATLYLRARSYDPHTGRFTQEDSTRSTTYQMPNEVEAVNPLSLNLYSYCYHNPIMLVDKSGNDPTFYATYGEDGEVTWRFMGDMKPINVGVSIYGFVPFLDNAILAATDWLAGTKTVTQDMYQDIATKVGASLGVVDNVASAAKIGGAAGKLSKLIGGISTGLTVSNFFYEMFDQRPYYNEIASELYIGYYESETFELTAERFLLYSALTEDLIKQGIVQYELSWGAVKNYTVNWEKYDAYFDKLGITAKEMGQLLK